MRPQQTSKWLGSQTGRRRSGKRRIGKHHRVRIQTLGCFETLEEKAVLAAQVLIAEIVAGNEQGLRDEDGDRVDWIELHNAGDESANLDGWSLTDDPEQLDKWTLPTRELQPEERMIVFASGKDRNTGTELHTNFQLSQSGEFLALVRADGRTVEHGFQPSYGALPPNRSFGILQGTERAVVASADAEVRAFVPDEETGEPLARDWIEVDFDDTAWLAGTSGVGFDANGGFDEFIGLDVGEQVLGMQSSVYVRKTFQVTNLIELSDLNLQLQYEDGFVGYLNGVEIARANAPDVPLWNSAATAIHRNSLAREFVEFNLEPFRNVLVEGKNVLAIHGLNRSVTSNDFLIRAEIAASRALPIESTVPRYFARPTPGLPNGLEGFEGITQSVVADVERGFYDTPIFVTLTSSTAGATMVYTTDGSRPTETNGNIVNPAGVNNVATVNVQIEQTTNLRAVALKQGFLPGPVTTESYLMLSDVIQQDFQATLDAGFPDIWGRRTEPDYGLDSQVVGPDDAYDGEFSSQIFAALRAAPTVSIATDLEHLFGAENGIYVNSVRSGADWERPTSVEIMMPDGRNVQADAGIRIQGDNVRNFDNSKKQSLRLEFREEYGPTKLRFNLFDQTDAEDSFDTIILRGAYNDGWVHTPSSTQFIRDQWARTTLLAMGQPQVHGRFVHVYLNGFYWGLYNAVERPVASFAADYFGGDKDEWDALNTGQVRDGSIGAWVELRNLARDISTANQVESNAAYQHLLGNLPDGTNNPARGALIDIPNYIDYLIVNFYGGNVDWPGRNYYVAREQGLESTGFKFFAWDTEKILNHGEGSDLNTNRLNERDGVAGAYSSLRNNDEFRLQFADHVHRHFFNGGLLYVDPEHPEWDPTQPERNRPAATYAQIAAEVELPLVGESARWGDTQTGGTRNDDRTYTINDWRSVRDSLFTNYFPRRSAIVLDQFVEAGLYPTVAAPVFNQHGGTIDADFQLEMSASGTVYFTLDGTDPRLSALLPGVEASGVSTSAAEYSGPIRLSTGGVVKARTLIDGEWSALNEATFSTAIPPLRITELMYHPRDSTPQPAADPEAFEFIEVMNVSESTSIDLAGIRLSEGVEFEFPQATLAAGERAVIVRDRAAFQTRYGNEPRILGEYNETKLSNGGEELLLVDAFGSIIQAFRYDDDWIKSTDGQGYSLNVVDPFANQDAWNVADGWRQSVQIDGSPGTPDQVDFDGDNLTTAADIDHFCSGLQANGRQFDLNGDGVNELADAILLIENVMGTQLGDVNLDGVFDSSDLAKVFQAGLYEDDLPSNARWSQGDWNCDGDFTTSDIVAAFARGSYRANAPATAIDSSSIAAATAFFFAEEDRHKSNGSHSP